MATDTAVLRSTILERLKEDAAIYQVKLHFTEPVLGTAPENPDVYSDFIASKKAKFDATVKNQTPEVKAEVTTALAAEEVAMLPEDTQRGLTVFRRDTATKHLVFLDFQLRGFIKEAARAMGGITAAASSIDKWVFIAERMVPILRDGKPLTAPDGIFERPLRAQTMQGPRSTLAASEIINPPATVEFEFFILGQGISKKEGLNFERLQKWLDYGALTGLGQWRSGSYGRFAAELKKKE